MSRSMEGGLALVEGVSSQHIGRSLLFTGLNSLMLQVSGMGEEEGLAPLGNTTSELLPEATPSKRELNLLESRFFRLSFSSSSGSVSPGGFFVSLLKPRVPRFFNEEREPSPFHPEGEDSASKKKLSFRVKDLFRLRLFSHPSSLIGD